MKVAEIEIPIIQDSYHSPIRKVSFLTRAFPSCFFYPRALGVIRWSSRRAKRGNYGSREWVETSYRIVAALEAVGVSLSVKDVSAFKNLSSPAVFIGNHMSTMETLVLPWIIRPHRPVTFVVKQELLHYPLFGEVIKAIDPVVLSRDNPRHDLATLLAEGKRRLEEGISLVVFPQTTRSREFQPDHFNTIGVKLALRAGVPVIPLALQTDAWGNGKRVKDFGKIVPSHSARFRFGAPITITGNGREEHQRIIRFIAEQLRRWKRS